MLAHVCMFAFRDAHVRSWSQVSTWSYLTPTEKDEEGDFFRTIQEVPIKLVRIIPYSTWLTITFIV